MVDKSLGGVGEFTVFFPDKGVGDGDRRVGNTADADVVGEFDIFGGCGIDGDADALFDKHVGV